jgi:hypothetical protein
MVRIGGKVPPTINKVSLNGGAACPSYGVGSMNPSSLIKYQCDQFNSTATRVFGNLLTCRQKWWPKRHPLLLLVAKNMQIES